MLKNYYLIYNNKNKLKRESKKNTINKEKLVRYLKIFKNYIQFYLHKYFSILNKLVKLVLYKC